MQDFFYKITTKKAGWENSKLCVIIITIIHVRMQKRRTKYKFYKGISLCWLHTNQQTTPVSMIFRKGAEESESQEQQGDLYRCDHVKCIV